jgi:hypothetical protein
MTTCISRYYPGSYPEFSIYPGNTGIKIGHVDVESVPKCNNKSDFNLVSKCEDKIQFNWKSVNVKSISNQCAIAI